jgi:hypothetical protein
MAVIELHRRTVPGDERALEVMTGQIQPLRLHRRGIQKDVGMLPVALVQVDVRAVSGDRGLVHQTVVDDRRVIVEWIEEPVLQADQPAGDAGRDHRLLGPRRARDTGGVVDIQLGRFPGVQRAGICQPLAPERKALAEAGQERPELGIGTG